MKIGSSFAEFWPFSKTYQVDCQDRPGPCVSSYEVEWDGKCPDGYHYTYDEGDAYCIANDSEYSVPKGEYKLEELDNGRRVLRVVE